MESTVFALSTPVGGAIAIMRISGANARPILEKLFTGRIEHRRAGFGRIADGEGETVDTCTAVFFEAPHSYTGEDMAEISVHGSYAVVRRLAELIGQTGLARPAEPGEFTKRAYLNGKMDLAESEAVMDLIASTAERQRRAAARQLEGRLSAVIGSLYERVKGVLAETAAFVDDDTDEIDFDVNEAINEIISVKGDISSLIESGLKARVLREGVRTAIIGSPNVGKSSLLNALIKRERAIVTEIPGTTRDTVEEAVSIEGLPVVFIDTAGIRETDDAVERMGIERALKERHDADVVLLLIDGSRATLPEDEELIASADARKTLAVITKSDLPAVLAPDAGVSFRGLPAVKVSALTGEGLTELRKRIASMAAPGELEPEVTNVRHIRALEQAKSALEAACTGLSAGTPDTAVFELREAMTGLASITGREDAAEDLVNTIFSSFCIGK